MDKNGKMWLTLIVLIVVIIASFILMKDSSEENGLIVEEFPNLENQATVLVADRVLLEEFLNKNISDISPEKEVLGGKFYLTNIEWVNEQTAIIDYEDGHVALRAEVKLSFTDETKGQVQVDSFEMRELAPPASN